jgi:hypothetical protein
MSEKVLIHKKSGMRIHYLETENYVGDKVEYKLMKNVFIITLQNEKLEIDDVDFSKQYFVTSGTIIPFAIVKKDSVGD